MVEVANIDKVEETVPQEQQAETYRYSCRKCRSILFSSEEV